jgi:leucyl-tRNA---protein transferase
MDQLVKKEQKGLKLSHQIKPSKLSFFITPHHACPYLKGETAQTVFLSPDIQPDKSLYTVLINQGFRRSGEHIYRPQCDQCQSCISVRIPVSQFKPNKQQKRTLKKALNLTSNVTPAHFNQQHFQLFDKYISQRHKDGDMYPTSPQQYKEFLLNDWIECNFLNFSDPKTKKLVATAVYDQVEDGLSAVYTYFDPDYSKFSPGRLAILKLIELAKHQNLAYVYLGYWIKDCDKMAYKGDYRPIECFVRDRWVVLT